MKNIKKIIAVLICIMAINYGYVALGIEIDNDEWWNSAGSSGLSDTIESGNYAYIEDSSGLYLVEYNGTEEIISIPTTIDGKKVVGIYTETFAGCQTVKKIIIPETVNSIFVDAFINCRTLEEIEVNTNNDTYASYNGLLYSKDYRYLVRAPEGIKGAINVLAGTYYICDYAFFNCEKVTSIHIPASVLGTDSNGDYGVGIGSFYGTSMLNTITVDSSSKAYTVYDGVLYKLKDNTTTKEILVKCPDTRTNCVTIPSTVTEIADYAFFKCENLVGPINLPSNLVTIGEDAFWNCKTLDGAINIPNTVTNLGYGAFYGCKNIEELTIGTGITEIPADCFAYCESVKQLVIPNTITNIKERAFFYCTGVESLTLSNNLVNIENWAFDYLVSLKGDLVIPDSVTKIGTAAFMNAKSLDGYIIIGNNVLEIGASAFYDSEDAKGVMFRGRLPILTEYSFLKPDIPYYYLNGQYGYTTSVLAQKDLRVYDQQPVIEFMVQDEVYQTVKLNSYGMKVSSFADPTVNGYKFKGWYYDANCTRPYNFTDEFMASTKIYADLELSNLITFNEEQITIEVGHESAIEYTYELEEWATVEDIKWTSSNNDVATVDEHGNVTAISKGEATITATYENAVDTIKVIVWKDENKLEITHDTMSLEIGSEQAIEYNYHIIDGGTPEDIIWTSSDEEIAKVEAGNLVALKDGVVTITAVYNDVSDSIEVTVLKNNSLSITEENVILKGKRSFDIVYDYYFNDGSTSDNIVWTSSNTNVARVVNGRVTAKLEGETTITATYKNVTDSIKIKVVPEDKFQFKQESIKVENTLTEYQLDYTWYSYDKTFEDIIWQSSDEEVATVENGVVKIVSTGTVSISAICGDSADAIIVNIVKPNMLEFAINSQLIRYEENKEITLDLDYYFNDGASYQDIVFTSDNEEVVKVVDNKLIQVGMGVANITAKYSNLSDTTKVEIVQQDYIAFEKFGYILKQGSELTVPCEYYIYNSSSSIEFSSSNEDIAKVDENGNIIALNEGEVIVTAEYGDTKAQVVIVVEDEEYRVGDINQDGLVDSADAAIALNIYKYNECTNIERILGDVNDDNLIDSADSAIILNMFKYNM